MKEKILSIIIPVYNVEQYIRSCIISLLNQDLDENSYEIILIDDGTPDHSIEVISDLIEKHHNIQVLHQYNSGPSAARNLGVSIATGEYILYVDSDDLLIDKSLKNLLDIAIAEKADLIVADYIVQKEDCQIPIKSIRNDCPTLKIKTGHELFMEDLSPNECYIWRTLFKRKYLIEKRIKFMEGISYEDVPYIQECYLKAGKCIRYTYTFYIYRRRHNTLSSNIKEKTIYDINKSLSKVWELSQNKEFSPMEREKLKDNLFETLSLNIWYISKNKNLLKNRKAYVTDLKQRIHNLKFSHGIRQKIVSYFFHKIPCTYIKIRSYF